MELMNYSFDIKTIKKLSNIYINIIDNFSLIMLIVKS